MQDIQDFRIGTAYYFLENKLGSKLKLILNYGKNIFSFKVMKDCGKVDKLKKQAEVIAKNLLSKKAQRNLAYKLIHLKVNNL